MMAHPGGRPLKFDSVEELQKKIDAYFAECDPHPEEHIRFEYHKKTIAKEKNGKQEEVEVDDLSQPPYEVTEWKVSYQKPYTITGLANFLETSRKVLVEYEDREEFSNTIKAAKAKVEHFWELQLLGSHPTGPIFNLKNNYGWKDKTETDLTTGGDKLNIALVEFVDGQNSSEDS